ncbi:MAG: PLxRFG domain-containing protein, partial [Ottowia sp.]|nr:PLxRFG domain-containing protein [Ottowia sp.]
SDPAKLSPFANAAHLSDEEKYQLGVQAKADLLVKHGKVHWRTAQAWQTAEGLPYNSGNVMEDYARTVNERFEREVLQAGVVFTDAELRSEFGLNDQQISLYREARAAIDSSLDMTARTDMLRLVQHEWREDPYGMEHLRQLVLDAGSLDDAAQAIVQTLEHEAKLQADKSQPERAKVLRALAEDVGERLAKTQQLQRRGYAPLQRFGRYTVDVVDKASGERLYFGMYESRRESNLARIKLAQAFPNAHVTQGTLNEREFELFQGVTPETVELFGDMLRLEGAGDDAQDLAFQEYLRRTKNNHSALKHLIHRKGIAGYSEDVGRVLAAFIYANARAGSVGMNAGKMERAIAEIPKEQGELKDVAIGLRDYLKNPREGGHIVRGFLFAQYLGGSVASALVNATQPFQVTMPWLSQFGGMKQAAKYLAGALADMPSGKYEGDLAAALKAAEDDGTVSPQEIHHLLAQAQGVGSLASGDGTKLGAARALANNAWQKTKVLWGRPFAMAEQFNRRSTFIAAYRLARDRGMGDPEGFARKAVEETQFVYGKHNKMPWGRGTIGGTLMTFKTYTVSYLELMHRMWTQGGKEGRRAVAWSVAMLLLVGGAGGLPFMEDAEDLIDGAGQLMGYNVSTKAWRDDFLRRVLGEELGGFLESGVSGLPGAPIDVAGRLGMGNLVPGTGLLLAKRDRSQDLKEMAGAAGDFVSRVYGGGKRALSGDFIGAALEMAPNAVRNAVKGVDMAHHGMYRDSKGYKVIDTTAAEALAKFVGFQPGSVARVQEANSFMMRSKSFYQQKAADIRLEWAQALFEKDETKLARVRQKLADWNRKNPDQRITVDMRAIWKRVREMNKDRSQRIADTSPKALRRQMRELAAEARGEVA